VGVSDHDSPAVSWGASRDPRAWQVKSFCQASALCSRTIAGLSEQFRAERTWIGGESTWISSQPDQASPVKSHRASLFRQTIGIGWGIKGEVEATPTASTAKGRGKCPWDVLINLIKNTAAERLPQRSTCHAPRKKSSKGRAMLNSAPGGLF